MVVYGTGPDLHRGPAVRDGRLGLLPDGQTSEWVVRDDGGGIGGTHADTLASGAACERIKACRHIKKGARLGWAPFFFGVVFGGVLLSHTVAGAVPSALEGLASGFGMLPGVSPPL